MAGRVRVAALVLTLVLVGAVAACGDDDDGNVSAGSGNGSSSADVKAPAGDPSVTGTISKATPTSFTVQDGVDAKGADLAAVVKVPDGTAVLKVAGSGYTEGSVDDLADGAKVKVWFTGPVAESYPVQATAGTVIITG